jgi:outer membrane protein W
MLTLRQRRFFDPNGRVQAYAGAGIARSAFFGEGAFGALEGAELHVDAAHGVMIGLAIGRRLR